MGDLVYLSTKNISFPKGLARKLIPKFIGLYKLLKDFGNTSFQLDLPSHLKRRGVHNVFHASLLQIYMANDDRLFPGRMDTQVFRVGDTEGEWAVERIRSHSGSRHEASFEIEWKSGDVTWLPYYQITHLQALTEYLDLLGLMQISQLRQGPGWPPIDDPQIFLGSITPSPVSPSFICFPLSIISNIFSYLTQHVNSALLSLRQTLFPSFTSITLDLELLSFMPPSHFPGVNHP